MLRESAASIGCGGANQSACVAKCNSGNLSQKPSHLQFPGESPRDKSIGRSLKFHTSHSPNTRLMGVFGVTARALNVFSKARSFAKHEYRTFRSSQQKPKPDSTVVILPTLTRNTTSGLPLLRSLLLRLASHIQMAVAGGGLSYQAAAWEA